MEKTKRKSKKLLWIIPVIVLSVLFGCFFIYVENYYHADTSALIALGSDETVSVTKTDFGWLFDGPSESDALIFYPGAKVEETAYAPLLRLLAEEGTDVLLVKMPFRLAVFGADKANALLSEFDYACWYIGGHSLGGTMAANFAAEHPGQINGLFLLASYPIKRIDDTVRAISVYGSEDGVLNMERLAEGNSYLPEGSTVCVIDGGNHAQFGNYGEQHGDGKAGITAEEQQNEAAAIFAHNK